MIILMGLAGSGKSTQGQMLAAATGRVWLSAGEVLRNTPDEAVHAIQQRGELVPDSITIPLMGQAIAQLQAEGKNIVLDGYPRTAEQAEWIAQHIASDVEMVARLIVPKPELFERLVLRGRADDQSREAIEERFRIVEQNIYAVCEILAAQGIKIKDIDGRGTVEEVQARLVAAITEVNNE